MGKLRQAVWVKTFVPWTKKPEGQCQVLTLRGKPISTNDFASVAASGLADGDVLQLVEIPLPWGLTSLHCAADEGIHEVAQQLVEAGDVSVDAKNVRQNTALHFAATRRRAGVVEDLVGVAAGCDEAEVNGWTPLHLAAMVGDEETMRALECSAADVDAASTWGQRPLHYASYYDMFCAASELLESGAADGAAALDGSQPLHAAASSAKKGLVAEELVSVAAFVDAMQNDGRRPLELAGAEKAWLRETLLMAGAVAQ
jgi:ankyrin repeat protein